MIQINERIPGTLVRGLFPYPGEEPWQIVECRCSLCRAGDYVALNDHLVPTSGARWLHLPIDALERVREPETIVPAP